MNQTTSSAAIDLYWLPLGAGGRSVRWNGRIYEALAAFTQRRPARDLYHSALEVRLDANRYVIEMAPVWREAGTDHGVVRTGPVGARWLGHYRSFRYEVRCWRGGEIPDVAEAVASPQRVSDDPERTAQLLALLRRVPAFTWGRDPFRCGDMWNSNSLVSWLLASTGHDLARIQPPEGGRAPGWVAGLVLASRPDPSSRPAYGDDRRTVVAGLVEGATGIAAVATALATAPELGTVQHGWGASYEEWLAAMPGDEFVPHPKMVSTRAITINAGPDRVWPWLAQIGLGRGGFYSYDALENLVGCRIRSSRRIVPELQQLRVGDPIRLAPGRGPCYRVGLVEPPRLLALTGADPETEQAGREVTGGLAVSWQWLLEPLDDGRRTRLVVRQRYDYPRRQRLLWRLLNPIDFAMERRMLKGIKARAEALTPTVAPGAEDHPPTGSSLVPSPR
jgi:hypothetical protein